MLVYSSVRYLYDLYGIMVVSLDSHDFEVEGTCHTLMSVGFPAGKISHLQLGISVPYRRIDFWIPQRKLS